MSRALEILHAILETKPWDTGFERGFSWVCLFGGALNDWNKVFFGGGPSYNYSIISRKPYSKYSGPYTYIIWHLGLKCSRGGLPLREGNEDASPTPYISMKSVLHKLRLALPSCPVEYFNQTQKQQTCKPVALYSCTLTWKAFTAVEQAEETRADSVFNVDRSVKCSSLQPSAQFPIYPLTKKHS